LKSGSTTLFTGSSVRSFALVVLWVELTTLSHAEWQWKALTVRCEQPGALVIPPCDVSPANAETWTMRNRSLLGPVLSTGPKDKICVKEVENLNEVGEL
jgi:hypothetical protein